MGNGEKEEGEASISPRPTGTCAVCGKSQAQMFLLPCKVEACRACFFGRGPESRPICGSRWEKCSWDREKLFAEELYHGLISCELCRDPKPASDLYWCNAVGCAVIFCTRCGGNHGDVHGEHISPFHQLQAHQEVYTRLKNRDFKRLQEFKSRFHKLAERLWEKQGSLHEGLAAAFGFDPVPRTVHPNLPPNRALALGKSFLNGLGKDTAAFGRPDHLDRINILGMDKLADGILSVLLNRPQTEAAEDSSALENQPSHNKENAESVISSDRAALMALPPVNPADTARSKSPNPVKTAILTPPPSRAVSPASPIYTSHQKIIIIAPKGNEQTIISMFPMKIEALMLRKPAGKPLVGLRLYKGQTKILVFSQGRLEYISFNSDNAQLFDVHGYTDLKESYIEGSRFVYFEVDGHHWGYFAGGIGENSEPSSDLVRFGAKRRKTDPFPSQPPMIVARAEHEMVFLGGFLYAIGGQGQFVSFLDSVERLNLNGSEESWQPCQPLPFGLKSFAAVAFNGKILVCGGESTDAEAMKTTMIFQPEGNTWVLGPVLNYARSSHGLVVCQGAIYAIGGRGLPAAEVTVERLSPDWSSWELLPERLPFPVVNAGFVVI